jgi:hypothetical protein
LPLTALLFVLPLLLLACGGGDDDDGGIGDIFGDNGEDADGTRSIDDVIDDIPFTDSEGAFAIVTIGDTRYEFELSGSLDAGTTTRIGVCFAAFGAIGGSGYAGDGSDVTVNIDIPPEDYETSGDDGWDPPSVRVSDDENGFDWRAGGDVIEGGFAGLDPDDFRVQSFSNEGRRASGSATFVDLNAATTAQINGEDPPEAVPGTFEISCGDE